MPEQTVKTEATGLNEVTRALRELVGTTRTLAEDTGTVFERELSMAIRISESLRDDVFSPDAIKQARAGGLNRRLRDDSHRFVDLMADVGGVAGQSALRFVKRFADESRAEEHRFEPSSRLDAAG